MSRQQILRLFRNYGTTTSSSSNSSFLTLTRKRVQSKNIQIIGVRKNQYDPVMQFMNTHFMDDPLISALKVPKDGETYRIMEEVWMPAIKEDLSLLMTKRKSSKEPKIYGVCVNSLHDSKKVYRTLVNMMKSTRSEPLQNLLNAWALITVQPKFMSLPPKSIFEICGLAVNKDYRRFGIAYQLLENAVILAKLKGFNWVRVDCTSPYSARICENSGFYLIYEKAYSELDGFKSMDHEFFKSKLKVFIKPLKKKRPSGVLLPFRQI